MIEIKAINGGGNIKLYIPFLLDCLNEDDAKKIVENINNSFIAKGYYIQFNPNSNINTEIESVGLLTEDFKATLERQKVLMGFSSFLIKSRM